MTTPRDFAIALLSGLGLPLTQNNITAMISAQAAEGGFCPLQADCGSATAAERTAYYNPLNITQPIKGSSVASGYAASASKGGPAIQAYPDWPTGLQAAITIFKNGFYKDILASFQASADPSTTLAVWAKNPNYGWVLTPGVNLAYGAYTFPQGPSTTPLPTNLFAQTITAPAPAIGPSIGQAGVGAVLIFGFWKFYEWLGKH
jgi:hypothetical protein